MSITVDDDTVRKTVELGTTTDTTVPIETAKTVVAEYLAASGLSATKLTLITLNLACHYALVFQGGQLTRKRQGETIEDYQFKGDAGLFSTHYGQNACIFDTTGILAAMAKPGQKAQFRLIGRADSLIQQNQPATGDVNDVKS